jgi:hypothetical protein
VTFFEKALGFSWPFWNVCSLRCLGQAIPGWVQVCVQTCLEPVVVAHTGHQRGEEDEAGGSRVRGQPGLHLKKKMLGIRVNLETACPLRAPHLTS